MVFQYSLPRGPPRLISTARGAPENGELKDLQKEEQTKYTRRTPTGNQHQKAFEAPYAIASSGLPGRRALRPEIVL